MILKAWAMILLFVGNPCIGFSQIIKVDKDWAESDSEAWQGVIDLNVDNIKNTQTIFQLAGDAQVAYNWRKNLLLSMSSLRLMFADNVPLENAGYQHFRYVRMIDSTFSVEAFTQIQFDQLLKIRLRSVTGGGPKVSLVNREWGKLDLRPGYMYEYEEEDSTGVVNRHHRLSNYVTLKIGKAKKIKFYVTLFYQPRIDRFSDYRLSPAFALELKVLKHLVVNMAGDVRYDSSPVVGVSNFTYTLKQGFGFRF